jgi:hypothetical protein
LDLSNILICKAKPVLGIRDKALDCASTRHEPPSNRPQV